MLIYAFTNHFRRKGMVYYFAWTSMLSLLFAVSGCRSASWHRDKADRAAIHNITAAQTAAFGKTEPILIESAEEQLRRRLFRDQELPSQLYNGSLTAVASNRAPFQTSIRLTPETALQIAARNNRDFQAAKETLYSAALGLDLEQADFRRTFSGILNGTYENDNSGQDNIRSARGSATVGSGYRFRNGVEMSGSIAADLSKLLTQGSDSSLGLLADVDISIPLLRGAGREIAAEPLHQAELDLLYAVYTFERFKRAFAVRVVSDYISVLQASQEIRNAEQNYKSLITATRRARRLADAGRLPEFQYDQSIQNELRARSRWMEALDSLDSRLDRFKIEIGLSPDTAIELDSSLLQNLNARFCTTTAEHESDETVIPPADAVVALSVPGITIDDTLGLTDEQAVSMALETRLDLRIAQMKIDDAKRRIKVAEDNLRAELTLFGKVQSGARRNSSSSAGDSNADIGFNKLNSSAFLTLDLPFNRTAERIAFRKSLIALEEQTRDAESVEDQVKLDIRNASRTLRLARENLRIQSDAVRLAERRVSSTDMLLQAGRAEIRDVLEAQEALINAQNALTAAAVSQRIAELEFQRDLDMLEVSADGFLKEMTVVPIDATTPSPEESGIIHSSPTP